MSRPRTAARRYADAAFELASRDDSHDAWGDGLDLAAQLLGDERVAAIVDNPAIALAEREAVVDKLLGKRAPEPVRNLVLLLVRRGRVDILPAVVAQYHRLLNHQRGIVAATVTSATELDAADAKAVQARIEKMTGSKVELATAVDESLIGGLTVRVGDRYIDASVRGRLERLRDQLVAGAR